MYAITEHKENAVQIKEALAKIIPHTYGEHTLCETAEWCKYKENPLTYM